MAEIRREALELRRKRLEKIAARARKRGVKAACSVEWDFPPHEAIVRRARGSKVDLIIAECHQGLRLKPWLIHLTDWELLRTSHAAGAAAQECPPLARTHDPGRRRSFAYA